MWRSVKHFAREMLRDNRLCLRPQPLALHASDGWMELPLYTQDQWQVQLTVVHRNVIVPRHRHLCCESMDLVLGGLDSHFAIDGWAGVHPRYAERLAVNLVPVPKNVWHEAAGGPNGIVLLSFQRWDDGRPRPLSQDWEAWSAHATS